MKNTVSEDEICVSDPQLLLHSEMPFLLHASSSQWGVF